MLLLVVSRSFEPFSFDIEQNLSFLLRLKMMQVTNKPPAVFLLLSAHPALVFPFIGLSFHRTTV